jgi:hypothetical protein
MTDEMMRLCAPVEKTPTRSIAPLSGIGEAQWQCPCSIDSVICAPAEWIA